MALQTEYDDRAENSYVVPPRPTAIPEAPVPPRRPAPAPQQAAPAPARPAPRQALPTGNGNESGWLDPEEAERQNIAAHKELGKDYNPKRFVTDEFLPEIARAVRTTVESMFGIGGQGQAVPAERPNVAGLARGEGAATRRDVEAAKAAVDPRNNLPPHLRSMAAANASYMFHMANGDVNKAKRSMAEYALYTKRLLAQLGPMAQVAIERGDMKALARILQEGYAEIPDGKRMEAKPTEDGLDLTLIDHNGKVTKLGEQGIDMLSLIATGMSDGTLNLRLWGEMEERQEVDPAAEQNARIAQMERDAKERELGDKLSGAPADTKKQRQRQARDEQQTAAIMQSDLPEEDKETAVATKLMFNSVDDSFNDNQRSGVIAEGVRNDIIGALPQFRADFGELSPVLQNKMRQLALEIWRGSPALENPEHAAEIAATLFTDEFKDHVDFNDGGGLLYRGIPFNIPGRTFQSIYERHMKHEQGKAERAPAPAAAEPAPLTPQQEEVERDAQEALQTGQGERDTQAAQDTAAEREKLKSGIEALRREAAEMGLQLQELSSEYLGRAGSETARLRQIHDYYIDQIEDRRARDPRRNLDGWRRSQDGNALR